MFACGILGSGIRNTAQGVRNPLKGGIQNPRSTDKDWNPVPGLRNPWSGKKRQVILSFGVLVILFNFLLHSWWLHDFRKQGEDLLNDDHCHVSEDPVKVLMDLLAWENSRHLATLPLVSPINDIWETSAEIPYWWRVTTQIRVVTRHQYGISALVSQTSFGGETSSSVAKCRLFNLFLLFSGYES